MHPSERLCNSENSQPSLFQKGFESLDLTTSFGRLIEMAISWGREAGVSVLNLRRCSVLDDMVSSPSRSRCRSSRWQQPCRCNTPMHAYMWLNYISTSQQQSTTVVNNDQLPPKIISKQCSSAWTPLWHAQADVFGVPCVALTSQFH